MDGRFRPEEGDRMDVDEVTRSRSANGTPTLPLHTQIRLPPLPTVGLPAPSDPGTSLERRPDYPGATTPWAFRPPSAEHHERRRDSEKYEPHHSHHRSDPLQYFHERTGRHDKPVLSSDRYSHASHSTEHHSHRTHDRPTRDRLRDMSPRSRPSRLTHPGDYKQSYPSEYPEYPEGREFERREYYDRPYPPFRDDHHFRKRRMSVDQYGAAADQHNGVGPSREEHYSRDTGKTFTFAHRRREHQRVRSVDEGRSPPRILPPAREILSGSTSPIDATTAGYSGRPMSREGHYAPPRAHSAGERLVRPGAMLIEYNYRPRDHDDQYAPEDILQSMKDKRLPPRPGPEYYGYRTPEKIPYNETGRPAAPTTYQSDRLQGPHRTGFPSSGLRSTAPATPPQSRAAHPEVSYRYPRPSLARLPRPPPRSSHSHSQSASALNVIPRSRPPDPSHTTTGPRSPAPSPNSSAGPPPLDTAAKARSKIRRMIQLSVRADRVNYNTPGPYEPPSTPPGPPTVPPPPQHILEIQLPRLVSLDNLPPTSARRLLTTPPHRDPGRTKEQDLIYAEWLFNMSTQVQQCLTRAVNYCPNDLLRAADELLFITHWLVTYMHQLGLSYYSKLRHEMRVAFWWKLNWSWFCVIQHSYDAAKKPLEPSEYEPFPDQEAIRTLSQNEMEMEGLLIVKKEDNSESAAGLSQYPSNIPEDLRPLWGLAKRLNAKRKSPLNLGENEWFEIGDVLVDLGTELYRFGLLDMDLGLLENEIMHRIIAAIHAWRERDATTLKMANEAFRKLNVEEQKIMVMAIKEDDPKKEIKKVERK